jgi:hypothetical protein
MASQAQARQLKDEGNRLFKAGDYAGADSLYSKAQASLSSFSGSVVARIFS